MLTGKIWHGDNLKKEEVFALLQELGITWVSYKSFPRDPAAHREAIVTIGVFEDCRVSQDAVKKLWEKKRVEYRWRDGLSGWLTNPDGPEDNVTQL